MGTSKNAKIQIETGQTLVDYEAATDSGDHQIYNPSEDVMSGKSGFEPVVRPNGMVSGRNVVSAPASGSNDVVDVAAFTAYSGGTLYSVSASTDFSITRPATDVAKINSITMDSSGTLAEVAGTDGSDGNFSETRGAAGGPPEIPADSVEIAQVRLSTSAAAAVTADEIYQVVGQHSERYDYPGWTVNNVGDGANASEAAKQNAYIEFDAALPTSHTSATTKGIYVQHYTPTMSDLSRAYDFAPAEKSASSSSQQYYGGTVNAVSESLGQGSFTALMTDGISDTLVANKNEVLTTKFFPDRNKAAYMLTQGTVSLSRSFPAGGGQIEASVTLTPETESAEFTG